LEPVLHVGKEGVTDTLVREAEAVLARHELVKVRVQSEAPEHRKDTATDLATRAKATLVQVLGRTFLLFKRHPKKPKIVVPGLPLPDAEAKGSGAKKNRRTGKPTRTGTRERNARARAHGMSPGAFAEATAQRGGSSERGRRGARTTPSRAPSRGPSRRTRQDDGDES
ncbi:MAG: YhbY family RNA-binding protein, partial [Polyangiaceae bacterium]